MGMVVTLNVLRVSKLFMSNLAKKRYGHDVAKRLEMPPSTTYNLLWGLEENKWMASLKEPDRIDGKPGHRLYWMTQHGIESAMACFTALQMST